MPRADRRRPGARPLPRLRPAQQRPHPALPERVGAPLPRGGPERDRRPGAALPLRRRRGGRGRRAGRAGGRVPGRDRRRARPLARLRLRGLAQPLPLEPRRRPRLGPLRRGRVPGDRRWRSRRSCARSTPCARCRSRWRRCAPTDAPGRLGDRPHPRGLPGRLLGAALDGGRGRRGAGARLRRRAAPSRRSRARARSRSSSTASRPRPIAIGRPRPLRARRASDATRRHTLALRPTPGLRIWSVSFAAGLP